MQSRRLLITTKREAAHRVDWHAVGCRLSFKKSEEDVVKATADITTAVWFTRSEILCLGAEEKLQGAAWNFRPAM